MIAETDETAKALRGLGGRLLPATYVLGPMREWVMPLRNQVYPSRRMSIMQFDDKFIIGRIWRSWHDYQLAAHMTMLSGFELLEKLAEQYPEIAIRLAEPTK